MSEHLLTCKGLNTLSLDCIAHCIFLEVKTGHARKKNGRTEEGKNFGKTTRRKNGRMEKWNILVKECNIFLILSFLCFSRGSRFLSLFGVSSSFVFENFFYN